MRRCCCFISSSVRSPYLSFLSKRHAQRVKETHFALKSNKAWQQDQAARAQLLQQSAKQELTFEREGAKIIVSVIMLSGKTIPLAVHERAPLHNLRSAIEQATGIPLCAQMLIVHGEVLNVDLTTPLSEAGLIDGDAVTLVRGELDFCGKWIYEDDAGCDDYCLHIERTGSDSLVAGFSAGELTRPWAQYPCTLNGLHITFEESSCNVYEGEMRSDGQIICGTWSTKTRMFSRIGVVDAGDTGIFILRRIPIHNPNI